MAFRKICASATAVLLPTLSSISPAHAASDNMIENIMQSRGIDSQTHVDVTSSLQQLDEDAGDANFVAGYLEGMNEAFPLAEQHAKEVGVSRGDGCTWSPDRWGKANFRPACDRHDKCYGHTSTVSRLQCDNNFHSDLRKICSAAYSKSKVKKSACNGVAAAYYTGVRKFGRSHYQGKGSPR
ncbi:MAG: phospholipase A2 [Actinomycetaceae bacterium]|nr:phospholipase A2 [Actinomycetaceae bacterium]